MKFLTYSILFSILSVFLMAAAMENNHEFYFSNMTMEKNSEAASLEVEFRLFSDDLEEALGESDEFHLRLGDEREHSAADSLIFDYLFDKVIITGKGWESATANYIGKRVDNDITYVYLEYTGITHWGEVHISNRIFFELFYSQQNQLSFVHNKQITTESTTYESPEQTLNFGG